MRLGSCLIVVWAGLGSAHDFKTAPAVLVVEGSSFELTLTCDIDALSLGAPSSADNRLLRGQLMAMSVEERGRAAIRVADFLERRIRVRFDGQSAQLEVILDPGTEPQSEDSFFGTTLTLRGKAPSSWQSLRVFASRALPPLDLRVVADDVEIWRGALAQGIQSPEISRGSPQKGVFFNYVALGFLHILPRGLDHILFVLGLFLLAPRVRPLLAQVSAFTLAHTMTLALSIFGVVSLPSMLVESMIALSIAYVGIENLFKHQISRWRILLVFLFGLLHGLGFAGVLNELGVPTGARVAGLLGFNLGVELGQIAVLCAAFAALGIWRSRLWYDKAIRIPVSATIAAAGVLMAATRLFA